MISGVAGLVAWALALLWALWAAVRLLGLERGTPLVQLIAFTPYVAATALIPVGVALAARQWWAALLAAAAGAGLVASVAPRVFGTPDDRPGASLTVMSANLRVDGSDPGAVVDLVRAYQVDVLALQEFGPASHAGLLAAGLGELLPYEQAHPVAGTTGSGLFSRFPLTEAGARRNPGGFWQAYGVVHPPGAGPVLVVSVHPAAPDRLASVASWLADLRSEPPASETGPPRILAGDFNATLDHAVLRRLLATGYRDAAAGVGRGLTPTWPYAGRRVAITPPVTIDHILVDQAIGVRGFGAYRVPRTDHRAIVARLVLPAR